jgi:hypothetical protein
MRNLFGILALLAFFVVPARALDDSKFTDADRQYILWGTSQTGVTSYTADPAGIGSIGAFIAGSTNTDLFGYTYSILSVGANATYTLSQTTKTWSAAAADPSTFNNPSPLGLYSGNRAPSISTSVAVVAVSGVADNGEFRALTRNPVFTFSNLSTSATLYIKVDGWIQKKK